MNDGSADGAAKARASGDDLSLHPDGVSPAVEVERIDLLSAGDQAGIVYLNRPGQLNAFDWEMLRLLEAALAELEGDRRVRAILITGRGRAFSAGADLKSYRTFQDDERAVERFIGAFQRVFGAIRSLSKPTVALVNGVAVAGGLELALSCDFAYAAASARLGDGHLAYGQIGGGGALTMLPRLIGPARARELVFSAKILDADQALAWGLVNAVHPDGELLAAGLAFVEGIASRSSIAVAGAKEVLNSALHAGTGLEDGLRLELLRATHHNLTSRDASEGLLAFSEGRLPRFTGE